MWQLVVLPVLFGLLVVGSAFFALASVTTLIARQCKDALQETLANIKSIWEGNDL